MRFDYLAVVVAEESTGVVGKVAHYGELLITISLVVVTAMLTVVTYLVHKDSVKELGRDNDNMHDIAVKEIDSNNRHIAAIREMNRISRRNRRGINY